MGIVRPPFVHSNQRHCKHGKTAYAHREQPGAAPSPVWPASNINLFNGDLESFKIYSPTTLTITITMPKLPSSFVLPDLVTLVNFPFAKNPHYEQAGAESSSWINGFDMFKDRKKVEFIQDVR